MPRTILLLACALVLGLGACVPPEIEDDDTVPEFSPDTEMGLIQERGVLRAGIDAEAFPMGAMDPEPGGFTVELAGEIAASLGVELEIVAVPTDSLGTLVLLEDLDVAFPMTPITERALETHAFSDPYYVGHQRLAAPAPIGGRSDLAGAAVCEVIERRTEVAAEVLQPDVGEVISRNRANVCLDAYRAGDVDAILAADVRLFPLIAREETLRLGAETYNVQGYGVMVRRNARGFTGFLDGVIAEMKSEGRWSTAYEEWVSPVSGEPPVPPAMSLEEAAALYPVGQTAD